MTCGQAPGSSSGGGQFLHVMGVVFSIYYGSVTTIYRYLTKVQGVIFGVLVCGVGGRSHVVVVPPSRI